MKKYMIAAMAALMALSATGCAGSNTSTSSGSPADSSSAADVSTPAAADDSAPATAEDSAPAASSAETSSDAESTADLQAVYDKIMALQDDSDDIIMFPETATEYLDGLYSGMSALDLKQILFYLPPVTGNACEILLIEAADSDNADKAEKIMKERVESAASDTVYPDVAEVWANHASVQRSGNLLCMIVLPMSCNVPDDVFAL